MRITSLPDLPGPGVHSLPNQSDKIESTPAVIPAVKEETKTSEEPFAAKYADLARREKTLRNKIQEREKAIQAREEQLKAKEADYQSSYIQKSKIPELFQRDAQQAMRELGLSGDQLTNYLLNQPNPQDLAIQELKAELASLKGLPDQTKKLFEDRETQQRTQAINVIRADVKSLIEQDPGFEMVKGTGSLEEIVDHMVRKSDEEGVMLSVQEAAETIEKQLTEEVVKLARIPKIQKLLIPPPPVKGAVSMGKSVPESRVNTLTHRQVSSASKPMSPRERAIAMLEGSMS